MGQEVCATHFQHADFKRFQQRLRAETAYLLDLIERGQLSRHAPMAGLELEAWLVDARGFPVPANADFLARLTAQGVVAELSKFNIELNVPPQPIAGDGLARLADELRRGWQACVDTAATLGLRVVAIGTLPTLREDQLSLATMSDRDRYRALNEQVLRQRRGEPIRIAIRAPAPVQQQEAERLDVEHHDVMLEAGTTSFQAHLQIDAAQVARYYNAAILASAVTVAVSANSPFLFGHRLWEETRIPLFEQAVAVYARANRHGDTLPRVSLGSGYAARSLGECFSENLELFPVMLPLDLGEPGAGLAHLILHNGTIWRWNRPLVGFDNDGTPHLRIEHRVMAAGPSLTDMMANLLFFYGLTAALAQRPRPVEESLGFEQAKDNFYNAGQWGLEAEVKWLHGKRQPLRTLILDPLLSQAEAGLQRLQVRGALIREHLAIIEQRVRTGQTGACWQRRFVEKYGRDFGRLTREYMARQATQAPVHSWDFQLHE